MVFGVLITFSYLLLHHQKDCRCFWSWQGIRNPLLIRNSFRTRQKNGQTLIMLEKLFRVSRKIYQPRLNNMSSIPHSHLQQSSQNFPTFFLSFSISFFLMLVITLSLRISLFVKKTFGHALPANPRVLVKVLNQLTVYANYLAGVLLAQYNIYIYYLRTQHHYFLVIKFRSIVCKVVMNMNQNNEIVSNYVSMF